MNRKCHQNATSSVHYTTSCKQQSSAPEDVRNYRPKQVELIEIINKPLFLHIVGYLYYWQMGFNSVFKGSKMLHPRVCPARYNHWHCGYTGQY